MNIFQYIGDLLLGKRSKRQRQKARSRTYAREAVRKEAKVVAKTAPSAKEKKKAERALIEQWFRDEFVTDIKTLLSADES
jgi:hypothetical protein